MTVIQLTKVEADLHLYLQDESVLISADFSAVVGDVIAFTSSVVTNGLRKALGEVATTPNELENRSFLEVADVIVEHHLRLVRASEREIARKSLLEAYFHAAGPQYVFEPPSKTSFVRLLRKWGTRDFAALLLSLHLFNSISLAVQDKVRAKMPDIRSFELYMLGLESVCRDSVRTAIQNVHGEPGPLWAREVASHIEEQLLHVASPVK